METVCESTTQGRFIRLSLSSDPGAAYLRPRRDCVRLRGHTGFQASVSGVAKRTFS